MKMSSKTTTTNATHTPGPWKVRTDTIGETVTGPDGNGQEVCTVVHTPGPWEVADYEECRRVRGKINDSRPIAVNVGSYVLATVWDPATIVHSDERCRANARLIAAAPDLLEVCERIDDLMETPEACPDETITLEVSVADLVAVRNAIRKARGETPTPTSKPTPRKCRWCGKDEHPYRECGQTHVRGD
jgi:hypothetical protein